MQSGLLPLLANLSVAVALMCPQATLILFTLRGQTLGKWIAGIRVVRTDGSRCGLGRLAMGLGRQRRCLHDLLADTMVVKA